MSLINLGFHAKSSLSTVGNFLTFWDELFFNPLYQREYVWSEAEQQALLVTIFSGLPIHAISVIEGTRSDDFYQEIVDGLQRLTTIHMFANNKIPVIIDGKPVFWDDLPNKHQLEFKRHNLSTVSLVSDTGQPVTLKQKLHYFHSVNFSGVPQSDGHRRKIEKMLAEYE